MAENPVTNELREFMKDHTGRHVWAHRVDIKLYKESLLRGEQKKIDTVTFQKPTAEIDRIVQSRVRKEVLQKEKHNGFEFSLTLLMPQINELDEVKERLESDLKNPYSDKESTNKVLKSVRAKLRSLRTEERHLREDIKRTAGMKNHVPVADEPKAS